MSNSRIIISSTLSYFVCLFFFTVHIGPANAQPGSASNNIDSYIEHLIKRQGIPGVALAVIKNGQVVHKNYYGFANIEHQVPVNNKTIFRLYSLTKPAVAVAIFQLIEQNKFNLDDAIGKHVQDLPQAWQSIQIKHLLSHSSGLPDMAKLQNREQLTENDAKKQVFEQALIFDAGKRYDYNQTNFWLLQKVIEKYTALPLADFILNSQFKRPGSSALFSSDSRTIIQDRATPYFYFSTGQLIIDHPYYLHEDFVHAMNGLNTNLDDFIHWDHQLSQGQLLKPLFQEKMFSDFEFSDSKKMFAHGWNHFKINSHDSYGFSGSYVTGYRHYPEKKLSVVLLSNGLSYWYNIDNIINHVASLVDAELTDPSNFLYETLLRAAIEQSFDLFKNTYMSLTMDPKYTQTNFEQHLSDVGYMLLNIKNNLLAIQVFKFNTIKFPSSWRVFESLGKAYVENNQLKLAASNFQKAIELNTKVNSQQNEKLREKIIELKSSPDF